MIYRSILGALALLCVAVSTAPAAAPKHTLELWDCMDMHYGEGNWTQRTGEGQGSDIGPALDHCLQLLRNTVSRGKIIINPGMWLMNRGPRHDLLAGNTIQGLGSMASMIVFNNRCQTLGNQIAFHFSGANGFTGGGLQGISLHLESGLGHTNCYGILLRGDASYQPDQTTFDDVYMSSLGNGYWWANLHVDGSARPNLLMRVVVLRNMQLFNARAVSAYIDHTTMVELTTVGCWTYLADNMVITANNSNISRRLVICANWYAI